MQHFIFFSPYSRLYFFFVIQIFSPHLIYWSSSHISSSSSPALLLRPAPADRDPLWFVLCLLDDGAELHAGVLQVVVHQHAVEELFVLHLHQPGRLLQLHKVILLQEKQTVL